MRILHSSAVSGRTSPTKYSQGFLELPRGGQEKGKNQGFCGCLRCVFLLFHFVSSWSPVVLIYLLVCKCFIRPCILTFVVMLFFFAVVLFPCVYSSLSLLRSLLCVQLFFFAVFSLGATKNQIKSQNIAKCLIVIFCFGACIPTLSLGPDNNPTRPGEELLKKRFLLPCFLVY